ncbi:hypothetical protein KC19_N011800, partial [Ceratodon purpureus]
LKAHLSGRPCGRKWPANEVPFTIPADLQGAPDDWELNVCHPDVELREGPHKFYFGCFLAVPPSPNIDVPAYSKAHILLAGEEVENSDAAAHTLEHVPLSLVDPREAVVIPGIQADSGRNVTLPTREVAIVPTEDARVPADSPDPCSDAQPVEDPEARVGNLFPAS